MRRVRFWSVDSDAAVRAHLEQVVRDAGCDVRELPFEPAADDALVVLISQAASEALASRQAEFDAWPGALLPVAVDDIGPDDMRLAGTALRDRSWIRGSGPAADQLPVVLATTPQWLLEWNSLQMAAGRSGETISSARELQAADAVVAARPRRLLATVPVEVGDYLDRSRRQLRRRRRALAAAASLLAAVALAAIVVASIQRSAADAARRRADMAALRARADRLSRLSLEYVGQDPDVPVLLARQAYQLDPGEGSFDRLRTALDAAPPHRSIRLPAPGVRLLVNGHTHVAAVVLQDGSVLAYSTTGRRLFRVGAHRPAPSGRTPVGAFSADGSELAVAYADGRIAMLSASNGRRLSTVQLPASGGRPVALAWSTGRALLVLQARNRSHLAKVQGDQVSEVAYAGVDRAVDVAAGAGSIFLLDDDGRTTVLRGSPLAPCVTLPVPPGEGPVSVVVPSADGRLVHSSGPKRIAAGQAVPGRCVDGRPARVDPVAQWPQGGEGPALAAMPRGDVALGTLNGHIVVDDALSRYPEAEWPAHAGRVNDVGAVDGSTLASVGTDRWLRLWREVPRTLFPAGTARIDLLSDRFALDNQRRVARPVVNVDSTSRKLLLGLGDLGTLAELDARSPGRVRSHQLAFFDSFVLPLRSRCGAFVVGLAGPSEIVDCGVGRPRTRWTDRRHLSLSDAAVTPDGSEVGQSDSGAVSLTDTRTGATSTAALDGSAGLDFDNRGHLISIDSTGTLVALTDQSLPRRVRLDTRGDTVRAAGTDHRGDRAVLITTSGSVLLADTATGSARRLSSGFDLRRAIGVRFSADDRLAVVIAATELVAYELDSGRVLAAQRIAAPTSEGTGQEFRDAAFGPDNDQLYAVRADDGLQAIPLQPWRRVRGRGLLEATGGLVPRPLRLGETTDLLRSAP